MTMSADKAFEIVELVISTSTGPTGGWLDSPKAILAELRQKLVDPKPEPVKCLPINSCNRHVDCAAAEKEFERKHGRLPNLNFHCHDDECEDCFGC